MKSFSTASLLREFPELRGRFFYFETLDSTNEEAKRRLVSQALSSGDVFLADYQTGGRGRRGNLWQATPGASLLMTMALEPDAPSSQWSKLSLAAAVAIVDVARIYGLEAQIKWPNDVYLEGKKCAGVLTEVIGGTAIVGVGLNLFEAPEGASSWQSHLEAPLQRELVAGQVLRSLFRWATRLEDSALIDAANRWHWLNGELVSLTTSDGKLVGKVLEMTSAGALLVKTSEGVHSVNQASEVRKVTLGGKA